MRMHTVTVRALILAYSIMCCRRTFPLRPWQSYAEIYAVKKDPKMLGPITSAIECVPPNTHTHTHIREHAHTTHACAPEGSLTASTYHRVV
jgi:hypothetical protein